ncbi:MAG: PilZ domain-containing protein, partial [Proteobacteria bacterium]|nr:PilZ domain-containing protein [Pseudomonadota bacterium]
AALRLLLVHALYRGPEKRRRERVTVGAPVQFRAGIRKRSAVLADFSIRGCRLLSRHAAQRDQSISILLPAELAGGKALKLRGTVVRTGPASGEESGTQAIAATFEAMPRSTVERLQEIVSTYAKGPAVLPEAMAAQLRSASGQKVAKAAGAGSEPKRSSAQTRPVDPRREPDSPAEMPEPADHSAESAGAPPGGSERRTEPRREYPHNVIALGKQATRVLIGRDISMGGMRVDANSWVRVGDELRVALHVRARTEPLVVEARVERDDAEAGLVLQFHNLSDSARDYLNKMVNFLPILAARSEEGGDSGVFVSEILERNGTSTE